MNDNNPPAVLDSIRWLDFINALRRIFVDNIEEEFKKLVIDHLGVESSKVTPEANFMDDLGADSLDHVEIIMEAEEFWGIEIHDDELNMPEVTIKACVDLIRVKLAAKASNTPAAASV